LELRLQLRLAQSLASANGYSEVEVLVNRARDLCNRLGGVAPELVAVLYLLRTHYMGRGDCQKSFDTGGRLLNLAQRMDGQEALMTAYYAQGQTLMYMGELIAARSYLEQALAISELRRGVDPSPTLLAENPRVAIMSALSLVLPFIGYADQARAYGGVSLSAACASPHPYWLAWSHIWESIVAKQLLDAPSAMEHAEIAFQVATKNGFSNWASIALIIRGWARVAHGQDAEGIAEIRRGLALSGMGGMVFYRSVLVEACAMSGRVHEALTEADAALLRMESSGERLYEAELYRIKAQLMLTERFAQTSEAEGLFRTAIVVARRQDAKLWELRATVGVARMLSAQHRDDEAGAMLAGIYAWFTEGFDTADLRDAKTLLEKLNCKR
jgi:tetratricopeptide (TPR) repeat protein